MTKIDFGVETSYTGWMIYLFKTDDINSKIKKKIGIVFLALLGLWLIGSAIISIGSKTLIFQNQYSWGKAHFHEGENRLVFFMRNGEGNNLDMLYHDNPSSDQVILYLHGNRGRNFNTVNDLAEQFDVFSPAYPGFNESEGTPSMKNLNSTAEIAYDWLINEKHVEENNITILGHSLGTVPAINLASIKPNAKQLIVINGYSSISSLCYRDYSIFCVFTLKQDNKAPAEKTVIPTKIYSYEFDKKTPLEEGEKLFGYFKNVDDKSFTLLKNYTHNLIDLDEIDFD